MKMIYCFDESTKKKLQANGYKFMCATKLRGKNAFLFMNNGTKLTFSDGEVEYSNKLYF
ncbi:MAG: hypothetical protein ACLTDM_04275 [Clostridium butyricum]